MSRALPPGTLLLLESPEPPDLGGHLTEAEIEITHMVFRGLSDRAIADARRASVRTVANQLRTIYKKYGVASRFELVAKLAQLAKSTESTRDPI